MEDQFIGNYRILKQIGAGGSAKVYLAVHRDVPNLKVILKILSEPRLAERFKQEADKLALLDGHPNICRIKHFFNHGDDTVIAMEYIDGYAFDERVKKDGRLPIEEALNVICDVLDILEFAHEREVYHRDIKPSNIMVDQNGRVKIIDFGIAKGKSDPNLTIAGTSCGTPAYMAPEQFTPTEDTNYALVDVYATGTTLFRMITGELPFKGDNEFALRDAKLFQDPIKPRTLNPSIPKRLEDFIMKSIDKVPENRFQSIAEMRQALLAISKDTGAKQEATAQVKVKREGKPRKFPIIPITIGVVAVAIIAVVAYFATRPAEPEIVQPVAVELLAPENGTVLLESNQPELEWSHTVGEGGSYILQYATDSMFTDASTLANLTDGSFTFSDPLADGIYYWRIYPVESDGSRGMESPWFSFEVAVTPSPTPTGTINVTVRPSGDVYLDNALVGRNRKNVTLRRDTGRYVLRVENSQSREKVHTQTIMLESGQTVRKTFDFTFPPAEMVGEVRVGSKPRGAAIYIDGALQKQKTNYTFKLKPGRHIIKASLLMGSDTRTMVDTVAVVADSTHKVIFDFE